jgi:hypothetical protein
MPMLDKIGTLPDALGRPDTLLADNGCQRRLNFPEKCRAKNPWFSSVGDQPAY